MKTALKCNVEECKKLASYPHKTCLDHMYTLAKNRTTTHVLHKDDFTQYAIDLGVWQGLCEDHGLPVDAEQIEITVTDAKRVG